MVRYQTNHHRPFRLKMHRTLRGESAASRCFDTTRLFPSRFSPNARAASTFSRLADGLPGSSSSNANPFYLPPDEQIFQMRDEERRQKLESRDRMAGMSMWERTDAELAARQTRIKPMDIGLGATQQLAATSRHSKSAAAGGGTGGIAPTVLGSRHREKENLTDFISKKRDMFLVQMSLDTKKAEIQKLEKRASMREDAVKRSELMLEQDAIRFDRFLKDNDKNAHEAIRRQEGETKEKQEKIAEYKRLTADRAKIEAEISKVSEQLAACLSYKKFLDRLVPDDFRAEQRKRRAAAAAAAGKSASASANNASASSDDEDEDAAESSYFRHPAQLLQVFADLEERSLFLIQNCQETEEGIDELRQKLADTERAMSEKNTALTATVAELREKIAAEHERAALLRERAFGSTGTGAQGRLLPDLTQALRATYEIGCHQEAQSSAAPLDLLSEIERQLESLVRGLGEMEPEWRAAAEKAKETQRRQRVRRERMAEQEVKDEERLLRMQKRATEVQPKRVGKPPMVRSPPFERKKKETSTLDPQKNDQEEIRKFFTA